MREYRSDIDGLRAIAVAAVILFHAHVPFISGGYIGVDVFFVISGFLITGIITQELAEGRFSLKRFALRRVRRLMPGLLVVLLATWSVGALVLSPPALAALSRSVLATLGVGANVHFWRQSGYFDPDADKAPLLHMWSLSLEEQFYLLFPLVLLLIWRTYRSLLIPMLLIGMMSSFVLSWWGTSAHPGATFYLLPTRAWELLLGGVSALAMQQPWWPLRQTSPRLRDMLAAGGVVTLLIPMFVFDEYTPFPGLAAVAPALGTTTVLVASSPGSILGRLLSWRPLVALGLISYCTYLWHQPMFVLYRAWTLDVPSAGMTIVLITLTLVLAWLTWRFATQPSRSSSAVPTPMLLRRVGLGAAVASALAITGSATGGLPSRLTLVDSVRASIAASPGADACFDQPADGPPASWQCEIGNATSTPSFLVAGDSHARALYPAFSAAANATGQGGRLVGRNGCVPLLGVYVFRPKHGWTDCRVLAARTFEYAKDAGVSTLILVARWSYYTNGDYAGQNRALVAGTIGSVPSAAQSDSVLRAALLTTLAQYASIGVRVVLVDQVPQQVATADEIYTHVALFDDEPMTSSDLEGMSVSRERHRQLQERADALLRTATEQAPPGVQRLSLESVYCDATRCPVGQTDTSWYSDADHLSPAGAMRSVAKLVSVVARPAVSAGSSR